MSELERLIQELCPNGVEYKTIGEMCDTITDYTAAGSFGDIAKKVKYLNEPDYAMLIRTMDLKSNFTKGSPIWISKSAFEYLWRVNLNEDSLILPNIGNCGEIYYVSSKILPWEHCALAPNAILVKTKKMCMKFLFYYFQTPDYLNKLSKLISPVGQTKFNKTDFKSILIPVPPMEVQSEIVRILDNFTLLTEELTEELTARKQQYQYYLDMLFESCNGESRTLDEIGVFTRGKRFVHADAVNQDGIPCIHYGELYTYYGVVANQSKSQIRKSILEEKKLRYAKKGDVVIVGAGENDEDIGIGVAWNGDYEVAVHDACYIFETEENSKFISYYLRSSYYHKQIKAYVSRGKICAISSQGIGKAIIKVPSIDEQMRIVDMIEQFYLYSNDITQGLPAEIELRQKQYEYYRDKLLTFKELE